MQPPKAPPPPELIAFNLRQRAAPLRVMARSMAMDRVRAALEQQADTLMGKADAYEEKAARDRGEEQTLGAM